MATCGPFGADRQLAVDLLALHGLAVEQRFKPPWRPDATKPVAEVYPDERGLYICQDFGGEPRSMVLPEWYAALETGVARTLTNKDRTNWTKRALIDTGRVPFTVVLSEDVLEQLNEFDLRVYIGFRLRWAMRTGEPTVAFSARWGAHWIGEPFAKARVNASLRRLRQHGLIQKVDERPGVAGRSGFLFALGHGRPDPTLSERREGT